MLDDANPKAGNSQQMKKRGIATMTKMALVLATLIGPGSWLKCGKTFEYGFFLPLKRTDSGWRSDPPMGNHGGLTI